MWGVIAAVGGVCMAVAVVSYVISEGGDHIMNDNDNDNGSGGGSDWDPFDQNITSQSTSRLRHRTAKTPLRSILAAGY